MATARPKIFLPPVVALMAMLNAVEAGHQAALMAPTEILAEQHFRKLIGWLEPLLAPRGQRVAWLVEDASIAR